MKKKSLSLNLFMSVMVITAFIMACFQLPSCKYQTHGTCTYEGLECPNALAVHVEDSLAYADCEYVVDSLSNANDSLENVILDYQHQLNTELKPVAMGQIHMNHDEDGGINLVYRNGDGKDYHLDYTIDDYFTKPEFYATKK